MDDIYESCKVVQYEYDIKMVESGGIFDKECRYIFCFKVTKEKAGMSVIEANIAISPFLSLIF